MTVVASNNKLSVSIRDATLEDVRLLTDLHCSVFTPEEHFPVMLGRSYINATYRWQVDSPQAYTLIAEMEGNIAGFVSVADGSYTLPRFIACLPEFFLSLITRPYLLINMKFWRRYLRRPVHSLNGSSRNFAELSIIAVSPNYRMRGVSNMLLDAVVNKSAVRGSRAIQAGIYKTNKISQLAFAKSGWQEFPWLETPDTKVYVTFLDPSFAEELTRFI